MTQTPLCSVQPPHITLQQMLGQLYTQVPLPALAAVEIATGLGFGIVKFTPTATSGSVNMSTGSVTGCTASLLQGSDDLPNTANVVLAWVRRKPGTTGAIAANTITITINSVEVGRVKIAAGAEEGSWLVIAAPEGAEDVLWDLANYPSISFGATAADSDVEVGILVGGPL